MDAPLNAPIRAA